CAGHRAHHEKATMQKQGKPPGLGGQVAADPSQVDASYDGDLAPRTTFVSDVAPRAPGSDVAPKAPVSDVAPKPASELEPVPRSLNDLSGPPPTERRLHPVDASLLRVLHESFSEHAGPDSRLDVGELQRSLEMKDPFLAERVLAVFDRDGNGVVTRAEFLDRVRRLIFGSQNDKLRFAFRIHD